MLLDRQTGPGTAEATGPRLAAQAHTTGNRNYSSHRLANIEQTKVGNTPL